MTTRSKCSLADMLSGLLLVIAVMPATASFAQPARRGFGGPIVLNPDDVPAFADPPAGIVAKRDKIPHGTFSK